MTRLLMLACSAAILLFSHAALAKPKIALTQIEGDAKGDIHEAVSEALDGNELSLIGSKEVNRAVDKLGDLTDLTEKDFRKLANELEADAIVLGKLDKVGRSRTLRFRLFIHKKMAKGFTVSFKNAKSEKFRSMLHDKMVDKIGAAVGDAGEDDRSARKRAAEDEDPLATKKDKKLGKRAKAEDEEEVRPAKKTRVAEDEDRPSKKAKAEAEDDEDASRTRKAKAEGDSESTERAEREEGDDAEGDDAEASPDDEDAPRKAKKKVAAADDGEDVEASVTTRVVPQRGAHRAVARIDVGVSVMQRRFKFNSRSNFPEGPKGVGLPPVPGGRFEAEIYPLGVAGGGGALSNLGIGVEYDRTLSLHVDSTNEMSVEVPVKQSDYSFGLRYRMALGAKPTSPTLTFGVGYGKRLFAPDTSVLTMDEARADIRRDTPHSHYTMIDPGVMFRLPVTSMVALAAGGRGLIVMSTGSIGTLSSYGQAKVYGLEGTVALDVVLGRFALRFSGELTQVGFTFDGVGALSRGLDKDVSTEDVGGLADRAIGGAATFAVTY
jgi:hypothetical protein